MYYSNKLIKWFEDIRKHRILSKITGKSNSKNFPPKFTSNNDDNYNKPEAADAFNEVSTNICQKLRSQIPKPFTTFETYINKVNGL